MTEEKDYPGQSRTGQPPVTLSPCRPVTLSCSFRQQQFLDVIDRAIQAHGSLGYSTDLPLEAMYRYARGWRLYDGPDEVHRQSVARQILRGYEPPPDELPSEYVPARRERARAKFAELLVTVTANDP